MTRKQSSEKLVRDIKPNTLRKYLSEEKIRILIEGLRGETSIAKLRGFGFPDGVIRVSCFITNKIHLCKIQQNCA